MQKHEDNLATQVDGAGLVPMPGVTVTVTDQSTGLAAALYSDNGVMPITAPIVTDNTGYYGFFAADGRYTLTFTNPRIVTFTRDVILEDPKDNPYATLAQLAAPTGSTNIGNGTETVSDSFNALQLADYPALRAYGGPRKSVYVTGYLGTAAPSGIAGMFVRDDSDTTTADNGGTVIVASNGKRWKRVFSGPVSVAWFGVLADSDTTGATGTDDTGAWRSAIAYVCQSGTPKWLTVPYGKTGFSKITGQLVITNAVRIDFESTACTLAKAFNGHLIKLSSGLITINNIAIAGNGATYTGGGIYIPAGTPNNITIYNPRILDTADSAFVFDGTAGESFNCYGGYLIPTNAATPASRIDPTANGWDDPLNPRNRSFINVSSSNRKLIDLTGMVTTYLIGGQNAGVTFNNGSMSPAVPTYISAKAVIMGVRTTVGFDIDGQDHRISNVNFAAVAPSGTYSATFASSSSGCGLSNCATPSGVIDSASGLGVNTNKFEVFNQSYGCQWQAATTNPSIGNGSIAAYHSVTGRRVSVFIIVNIGSTTALGSGSWKFTLPYQASPSEQGSGIVRALRSGVAYRTGTAVQLSAGSPSTMEIYSDNSTVSWGPTTPVTWGSGDYLQISFQYTRA